MDMTIRPATPTERLFACEQSLRLAERCGNPGHLWGELDNTGTVFVNSWETFVRSQNTPEFKAEFNTVLDMLRFDERYGGILKNRASMIVYCLDRHMKQAEKGIRFIDPDGKERFRIPDGEMVRIITSEGGHLDRMARYVDEAHAEIGGSFYDIREFAEWMEQSGSQVIPIRSALPDKCYNVLPSSDEIIIVRKGESGYYHTDKYGHDRAHAQAIADEYNAQLNVTKAQAVAMLAGSMFGWHVPAADPKGYGQEGRPIKPKHHDRGDAR